MFPYGEPSRFVSVCRRAPLTLESEIAPEVDTEYCDTTFPTSNVLAPASETESEIGALGCTAASRSAHRPPQPVKGGWSGMEVCHWVTWSECENNCGGRCRMPPVNCARVIGNTSVPVLNSVASLPSPNRVTSSGQAGCKPYSCPSLF